MTNDRTLVTKEDMDRLAHLVRTLRHSPFRDQQQLELLDQVLENANALASEHVPGDVIQMNSRFRVLDLDSGRSVRYALVYPENADISKGRISVLAPVGTALLGHRRGDVVEAKVPGGSRRLKIEHVLRRPGHQDKAHPPRSTYWSGGRLALRASISQGRGVMHECQFPSSLRISGII